jgi:DNA polymerase-3 subunit delta
MVINNFNKFQSEIKKDEFKGAVLIYGDEKYLINKSICMIYKLVKVMPEINIIKLEDDNITRDNIINSCETIPCFSSIKVVHIKNPDFLIKLKDTKGTENSSDVLETISKYIKDTPDGIILLISFEGELNGNNKAVALVKNNGCLVQYNKVKGKDLEKWAEDFFKNCGKDIKKSELSYFMSMAPASINFMETEIQKICDYALDETTITREHIDAAAHKSLESNIFKMVDSISKKNADNAVSILNALMYQGEEALRILGMITRQYRILCTVKDCMEDNMAISEIKEKTKIKIDFIMNNYINQAKVCSDKYLASSMKLCLDADNKLKNSNYPEKLVLEMLIVNLCK